MCICTHTHQHPQPSDVRPMSSEDKKDAEAYGWDQEAQHGELGVRKPRGEPGFTPLEHTYD